MPTEDMLSGVVSPRRKRPHVDTETPQSIRALDAETYFAFFVLSNSLGADRACDSPPARGPLGFYGAPHDCLRARLIQLSWTSCEPSAAPQAVKERFVRIPGVIDEGEALGDVLLEFADALLHASAPRVRLVTNNVELNVGILLREMERCQLRHARKMLERAVRTRGVDLMCPSAYAWLTRGPLAYPSLENLAGVMPPGQRGFPEFRTGADEVALYLHFAAGLQELAAGVSLCELVGHEPVRVSRMQPRDNGVYSHDCARCGRFLD